MIYFKDGYDLIHHKKGIILKANEHINFTNESPLDLSEISGSIPKIPEL